MINICLMAPPTISFSDLHVCCCSLLTRLSEPDFDAPEQRLKVKVRVQLSQIQTKFPQLQSSREQKNL